MTYCGILANIYSGGIKILVEFLGSATVSFKRLTFQWTFDLRKVNGRRAHNERVTWGVTPQCFFNRAERR